jgi:type IV secretion system protein VirB6
MKKFCLLIIFILGLNISFSAKSYSYDSLLEYETQSNYAGVIDFFIKVIPDFLECIAFQSIIDFTQLNKNCIPRLINSDPNFDKDCDDSKSFSAGDIALKAIFSAATILTISITLGFIVALSVWVLPLALVALAGVVNLISPCFSSYILAPHEYINALLGRLQYQKIGETVQNTHPDALTAFDLPFFYNCLEESVPGNIAVTDKAILDKHYGNMNQTGSPYCKGPAAEFALNNLIKRTDLKTDKLPSLPLSKVKPGSMIIGDSKGLMKLITGSNEVGDLSKHNLTLLTREDIKNQVSKNSNLGYFRLYAGKIQLCAAQDFGALFRIGCTSVAPPIEQTQIDLGYSQKTRCQYFLSSRQDLQSLGYAINRGKTSENGFSPVGLFLSGDLHVMSTVVGCIQDLLVKIVIGFSGEEEESFLYQVQKAFSSIVKVILILYLSILAIKIMSAPQAPQMGEVGLYIIKFVLVIVFTGVAGPSIWYNAKDNSNSGLYPMIIEAANGLSDAIIQGTNNITPVPMCYYDNGDATNLLSEREVSPAKYGSLQATLTTNLKDPNNVKLTLWDYLDCKIVNYLNFNSCKFTLTQIAGVWLGTFFLLNFQTMLIGFLCLIFSIVIFLNIIRFVHIAIINLFAITLLVLISPIMISFALFEYTKQTFQTWFKTLLGFIFYPALVLSFIALMIATFDSIFYGTPLNKDCTKTANCTIKDICGTGLSDNNSLYCVIATRIDATIKDAPANLCSVRDGTLTNIFSPPNLTDLTYSLSSDFWSNLLAPLGKMVLFAILFYNMMTAILGFFEGLLSVYGISAYSISPVAIGRTLGKAAMNIVKSQATGSIKAMDKLRGKK